MSEDLNNSNDSGNVTNRSHGVSNVKISDSNIGIILTLFTIVQIFVIAFILTFVYSTCNDVKGKMVTYESQVLTTLARMDI